MLKRNKGITLIALIVTIIVLLILAGVSIMMLTGQNGILNRANQAKSETTSKSAEEKVKMAIMTVRAESNDGSLNADKLVEEITNSYKGQAEKSTSSDGFPVNITVDGKNFEVNGDGKIATSDTTVDNTGNGVIIDHSDNDTIKNESIKLEWSELIKVADMISKDTSITKNTSAVYYRLNGTNGSLTVGDKTTVRYNNETKNVRIIGFNHDTLSDNANKKAGITFEFIDPIEENVQMNSERTSTGGWESCELRTKINSQYLGKMEDTVKNAIKTVNKKSIIENAGESITKDKLWLMSCSEFVINPNETLSYWCSNDEGETYKYYTLCDEKNYSSKDSYGWLRSQADNGYGLFGYREYVRYYGRDSGFADKALDIMPCFCI